VDSLIESIVLFGLCLYESRVASRGGISAFN
jgi:hypothetical protein